jgi:hypothetical protein
MVLDTGTMLAIIIALAGACTVMALSMRENMLLRKEIRRLQVRVRDSQRKDK